MARVGGAGLLANRLVCEEHPEQDTVARITKARMRLYVKRPTRMVNQMKTHGGENGDLTFSTHDFPL